MRQEPRNIAPALATKLRAFRLPHGAPKVAYLLSENRRIVCNAGVRPHRRQAAAA
jgi:hypothetical protein